jgi:hypothetical protein
MIIEKMYSLFETIPAVSLSSIMITSEKRKKWNKYDEYKKYRKHSEYL